MREMRWKCEEKGCYRQLMPRLGVFDECFPGRIGMSDIDAAVEIAGHFLFLEWKAQGGAVTGGQRIMFERMTALSPKMTVVVVNGHPREMTVQSIQVFRRGVGSLPEPCDIDKLKARIKAWSDSVNFARTRPSRRGAA